MKKNKAKNEEIKDGEIIEDKAGEISTSSANTTPERIHCCSRRVKCEHNRNIKN